MSSGQPREDQGVSLHRFETVVRSIHDHLYANANIRTPEELQNEVAKIFLALVWAQREGRLEPLDAFAPTAVAAGDPELCSALASEVRHLFEDYKRTHRGYQIRESINLDDLSVAYVRSRLNEFSFIGAERDWLGDALEVFRSTAAKRLGGQFFTDQRVTDLAMRLLEFDPLNHDLVDVCAGTGGFLIAAHKRALALGVTEGVRAIGIEVDPKLTHLANSTLAHFSSTGDELSVFNADSFKRPSAWDASLRRAVAEGTHKRLASNPPFGVKITIKDPEILSRFDLGHGWTKVKGSWEQLGRLAPRPPDILFMERNLQFSEPGVGRVALVTPYQILSGPKLGYVREWLLRHARLIAVVDLPDDTFQPWTGTKTSLVVYERRMKPLSRWTGEDYPIFMAVARDIGHDRRGNPVQDERGQIKTDLPTIAAAFDAWRDGQDPATVHQDAFIVQASQITQAVDLRINASFYKPSAATVRSSLAAIPDGDKYQVVRLGDVTKRVFFPGRFKRNYVDDPADGILFLGGSNITQLVTTNKKYLSKKDPHLAEMRVQAGWVLVTRSGSTGIVSSVPLSWEGLAMSEHVIRIVPNNDILDGHYIEAYLRSELGQRLLAAGIFGSVIDEITPQYISDLPIPVPRDEILVKQVIDAQGEANEARDNAMRLINESLVILDRFHGFDVS